MIQDDIVRGEYVWEITIMVTSVVSTYMGFSFEQSGKKYISIAHMETAGDAIVFEEE